MNVLTGVIQSDADRRVDAGGDPPKGSSHPAEPVPGSALHGLRGLSGLHHFESHPAPQGNRAILVYVLAYQALINIAE
jgi:hypothetical protein